MVPGGDAPPRRCSDSGHDAVFPEAVGTLADEGSGLVGVRG